MTGREKLEAQDKKKAIYYNRGGRCKICNTVVPFSQAQLAHKIGQTKANLKKYGKEVIHNEENLEIVCSLKCNSAVDISFNPRKVLDVLSEIIEGRK